MLIAWQEVKIAHKHVSADITQERGLDYYKQEFFEAGNYYGIDPYLMLAIANLESAFGVKIPPGTNNPFGRKCGKGQKCIIFRDNTDELNYSWVSYDSWNEAIWDEAKYLRENYYDKGLKTPSEIGTKYAEDPHWASKIIKIMFLWK